eukprot:jgi/Ulvmu1/7318/UM035_0107.1
MYACGYRCSHDAASATGHWDGCHCEAHAAVLLQVVDVYQQCTPTHWTTAADSPWNLLTCLHAGRSLQHDVPVPLQRGLMQVVATAQRLQIPCPENLSHTTTWSASSLTPVLALLATAHDSMVVAACEETVHCTLVVLGLHAAGDDLVLPWTLMLPRGCPSTPQNQQRRATAMAVAGFFTAAVAAVCRRPFDAWGAIEKIATSDQHSSAESSQTGAATHRAPSQVLLHAASSSGMLLLFEVFRAALRRFRRSDSSKNTDPGSLDGGSARQAFQEADDMVWTYIAGVARLILPQARCSGAFAAGLLGLAVDEWAALPSTSTAGVPRVSWAGAGGSPAAGAGCSLTIAAGDGTPAMLPQLLQWLWGMAGGATNASHVSAGVQTEASGDRPVVPGSSKKKQKRARVPHPVQGDGRSVLISGRLVHTFNVLSSNNGGLQKSSDLSMYGCFSAAQSALASCDTYETRPSMHQGSDYTDQSPALIGARQTHEALMGLLGTLQHARSHVRNEHSTAADANDLARAYKAAELCCATLPDAHLNLLSRSCTSALRHIFEQTCGNVTSARREAASQGESNRASKKRKKCIGAISEEAREAQQGTADVHQPFCDVLVIVAAVCVETRSRGGSHVQTGLQWSDLSRMSHDRSHSHTSSKGHAAGGVWRDIALVLALLMLTDPAEPSVDRGIMPSTQLASKSSTQTQRQPPLEDVALLLAAAASQGVSNKPTKDATMMPALLSTAVKAAIAGRRNTICQLLSQTAQRRLALLPASVLQAALQGSISIAENAAVDAPPVADPVACVFALAEACTLQNHPLGADELEAADSCVLRAHSLACQYSTANSSSPAKSAALSFLHTFYRGLSACSTDMDMPYNPAVQSILRPPDDSLLQAAIQSCGRGHAALVQAACLRVALHTGDALAMARLLQADPPPWQPLKAANLSRALASVLMAAQDHKHTNSELTAAAHGIATAVRAPVLRMLVRGMPANSDVQADAQHVVVDWQGVAQLALHCLQCQPLQVRFTSTVAPLLNLLLGAAVGFPVLVSAHIWLLRPCLCTQLIGLPPM